MEAVSMAIERTDGFVVCTTEFDGEPALLVNHRKLYNHPPIGPTPRCRILITGHERKPLEYVVHILFREVERSRFSPDPGFLDSILKKYSPYSATFKFCPGIAEGTYREYYDSVRFDPKSLRKTESPVFRIDSNLCPMWFELGKFVPVTSRESESVLCRQCNRLKNDLLHQMKRTSLESPSKKVKRCSASSRARISYMSPTSQSKRMRNVKMRRDSEVRKLRKYDTELPLNNEQDEEMSQVVSTVESKCSKELSKLFEEGDSHGVGERMREVWANDKRAVHSEFKKDQDNNSKLVKCVLSILLVLYCF